ncbi:MAG: AraC family transcriptional regulator [Phycisphaerales bacterium]|nr:AraC family transcriptional regulator [Phycisphaerales bacterium]
MDHILHKELLKSSLLELIANKEQYELLVDKKQNFPQSFGYHVQRYRPKNISDSYFNNIGLLIYQIDKEDDHCFLELQFCTIDNKYCLMKSCSDCAERPYNCHHGEHATIDIFSIIFPKPVLLQFVKNVTVHGLKEEVISFQKRQSFRKTFSLSVKEKKILNSLLDHNYQDAIENIYINTRVYELLLFSLDYITPAQARGIMPACRFINNPQILDAIYRSRDILVKNMQNPYTIKELSKEVLINESYLKQGFKEVFGITIFDFFQQQRMEHAKYLLYEKCLSVTEVSHLLGYSTISHFSVAFKKYTGMKACSLIR